MSIRIVEAQPSEVIVTMNKNRLLKFIGWCEAHRSPGEYEPAFLDSCLTDLELAREGDELRADITVTCAACSKQHAFRGGDAFYDVDAGEWFCNSDCPKAADSAEFAMEAQP